MLLLESFCLKLIVLAVVLNQSNAVNLAQMKNQQKTSQQQQQPPPLKQTQQQQPHSPQQSMQAQAQVQAHQAHHQHQLQHSQQAQQLHQAQYVHDKDPMQDIMKNMNNEEDLSDAYPMLQEFKTHESQQPSQWNPFSLPQFSPPLPAPPIMSAYTSNASPFDAFSSGLHTPKFLPFFGLPQPFFLPYPFYFAPEMFLPAFSGASNDIEDTMSRASNSANRRPIVASAGGNPYQRNSPIYYVRMPPTPYMFLPSLSYASPPSSALNSAASFGHAYSPILPYQAVPAFPSFSSVFNLPINFLSNGKPSSIYQMGGSGSPNDIQNSFAYNGLVSGGYHSRPSPLALQMNPYRPSSPSSLSNYFQPPQSSYGLASSSPPQQDSKLTSLKRPFVFNGRPDDIYILPNNFNSVYPGDSGYF